MNRRTSYTGPERRIHKVCVTQNTEYHLRRDVCVAVKSRIAHEGLVAGQLAVNMQLQGCMDKESMIPIPGPPKLGLRMYFARGDEGVFTSPVVDILRPSKSVVAQYPVED